MKKNYNVELLRAFAILLVVIYHIRCIVNYDFIPNNIIMNIINFGGEIGVTLFFIISGFGIYKSIDNMHSKNNFKYKDYIKRRFSKISPNYYFCLLICLTLTGSAIYWNKQGLFDILTHVTYTHNLFVSTHGSINGILWTMATFMQFYLIAPVLYKVIKKKGLTGGILLVCLSIILKTVVYNYLGYKNLPGVYYFVYGRQVITALDNFVIGMIIAYITKSSDVKSSLLQKIMLPLSICMIYITIMIGMKYGVYQNNFVGYIWHTLLAIFLGLLVYSFMGININKDFFVNKILYRIGESEYEIYLWHFILISNIVNTGIVSYIRNISGITSVIVLLLAAVIFGCLIDDYKKNKYEMIFDTKGKGK